MDKLQVGQWWADPSQVDHRRFKITKLSKDVVHYVDCYETGSLFRNQSSRIQWEMDVETGRLVTSTVPVWGMR